MENKVINKSILFIVLLLIVKATSYGQNNNCDSHTMSDKKVLWTYNTDPNKKLYYTISFCKHNGIHPSTIDITKSDEYDTSEINGVLKTDIGYFDLKDIDSTVASYNYQNDKVNIAKDKNENQSISMLWESWFGLMRFEIYAKQLPELTFEGTCTSTNTDIKVKAETTKKPEIEKEWSTYMTLWKCNTNPKLVLTYRVKIAKDGINSTIEITGPKVLDSQEIHGKLYVKASHTDGDFSSPAVEIIDVMYGNFSRQFTFDFNNINQISFDGSCFNFGKLYRTKIKIENDSINKPYKIKTKPNAMGRRG
ncbi:MAG: hypothetical protein NTU43_04275 [Bacteroidetes bacterium]|nr:hypothetical protein [Bacteroidota bacterium]